MSMKTPGFLGLRPSLKMCWLVACFLLAFPIPAPAQTRVNLNFRLAPVAPVRHWRHGHVPLRRKLPVRKKAPLKYAGRLIVPGVRHVFFRTSDHGLLNVHLLEVDLNRPTIRLELSHYAFRNRQATVPRLASHQGVVAAINGSFFQFMPGSVATPVGIVMVNGQVLYDTRHRRTSFGINSDNEAVMGIPKISMTAVAPDLDKTYAIDGVNTRRGPRRTILYTPHFSDRTQTNRWGRDVIVRGKKVVGYTMGNAIIPRDGYVLSFQGMGKEVMEVLPPGTRVEIATIPEEPRWDNLKFLITGGPQLVHAGRIYNTYFQEKFRPALMYPNARSAVGITAKGKLLLVTVNPVYPGGGITYTNLARLLQKMNAVEAMNLDGGSSATLCVNGRVVNRSDGWHRAVNNALLIYAG